MRLHGTYCIILLCLSPGVSPIIGSKSGELPESSLLSSKRSAAPHAFCKHRAQLPQTRPPKGPPEGPPKGPPEGPPDGPLFCANNRCFPPLRSFPPWRPNAAPSTRPGRPPPGRRARVRGLNAPEFGPGLGGFLQMCCFWLRIDDSRLDEGQCSFQVIWCRV